MFYVKLEWEEDKKSNIGRIINQSKVPETSPIQVNPEPSYKKRLAKQLSLDLVIYIPISEDFTWEMKSSFKSALDAMGDVPVLGDIMQWFARFNNIGGSLGGKVGAGNESMKFQVWNETEPFSMGLKLKLYTKTDPYWDVYLPAIALVSQNILSLVKRGKGYVLYTPGINSKLSGYVKQSRTEQPRQKATKNSQGAQQASQQQRSEQIYAITSQPSNKIISRVSIVSKVQDLTGSDQSIGDTEVPILILKTAILETSKPTFSKDSTESGYPMWAEVDLNIQSSFSAADDMFVWQKPKRKDLGVSGFARDIGSSVFR